MSLPCPASILTLFGFKLVLTAFKNGAVTPTTDRAAADASNGSVPLYRVSDSLFQEKVYLIALLRARQVNIGIGSIQLVGVLVS